MSNLWPPGQLTAPIMAPYAQGGHPTFPMGTAVEVPQFAQQADGSLVYTGFDGARMMGLGNQAVPSAYPYQYKQQHGIIPDYIFSPQLIASTVSVRQLSEASQVPIKRMLPFRIWATSNGNTVTWTKWSFNPVLLDPTPEEAPARTTDFQRSAAQTTLGRHARAFKMNAFVTTTADGQTEFIMKTIQIATGMIETACLLALNALKASPPPPDSFNERNHLRMSVDEYRAQLELEARSFAILQKDANGFSVLADMLDGVLKNRGIGDGPRLSYIPAGARKYAGEHPANTLFLNTGKATVSEAIPPGFGKLGAVYESKPYFVESENKLSDTMVENVTVGNFFACTSENTRDVNPLVYKTSTRDVWIFSVTNDIEVLIPFADMSKYAGLYDHSADGLPLTEYGERFFAHWKSWHDLFEQNGCLDAITKKYNAASAVVKHAFDEALASNGGSSAPSVPVQPSFEAKHVALPESIPLISPAPVSSSRPTVEYAMQAAFMDDTSNQSLLQYAKELDMKTAQHPLTARFDDVIGAFVKGSNQAPVVVTEVDVGPLDESEIGTTFYMAHRNMEHFFTLTIGDTPVKNTEFSRSLFRLLASGATVRQAKDEGLDLKASGVLNALDNPVVRAEVISAYCAANAMAHSGDSFKLASAMVLINAPPVGVLFETALDSASAGNMRLNERFRESHDAKQQHTAALRAALAKAKTSIDANNLSDRFYKDYASIYSDVFITRVAASNSGAGDKHQKYGNWFWFCTLLYDFIVSHASHDVEDSTVHADRLRKFGACVEASVDTDAAYNFAADTWSTNSALVRTGEARLVMNTLSAYANTWLNAWYAKVQPHLRHGASVTDSLADRLKQTAIRNYRLLHVLLVHDFFFPLSFLGFRDGVYKMGSMIYMIPDGAVGYTFVQNLEWMRADDRITGTFTMSAHSNLGPVILNPENFTMQRYIISLGYEGGEGHLFYDLSDYGTLRAIQSGNRRLLRRDIISVAVPAEWRSNESVLDITGRCNPHIVNVSEDEELHYPSAPIYSDMLRVQHMPLDPRELESRLHQGIIPVLNRSGNTVYFRAHHRVFKCMDLSTGAGEHNDYKISTDMWGKDVYPGCAHVRRGARMYLHPVFYDNAHHAITTFTK